MRALSKLIVCISLLFWSFGGKAQTVDSGEHVSIGYVDSLMKNDTLMRDLSAFIDSVQRPKTLLAIEMGVGNGFFTTKSATAATGYTEKTFLSPSVTYLHRSGLGISATAYATMDMGEAVVYQGAVTPSFDIGRRNWAAGISYTRYINKDSVSFGIDPLRNDIYSYAILKKFWLEPGVTFDFSFDSYKLEEILESTQIPPVTEEKDYNIHAHIFSTVFTIQHDFEWFGLVDRNDQFAFTPNQMALSDAANYGGTTSSIIKKGVSPTAFAKPKLNSEYDGLIKNTGLSLESLGALFNAIYTYKHFLLSPQLLVNYFIGASAGIQPLRISYLMNVGLVF